MNLLFNPVIASPYKSPNQKIRVLSEHWAKQQIYCLSCGHQPIDQYDNNSKIADFFCQRCGETFELKSQAGAVGTKIVDGAYGAMMTRLAGGRNPNLLLLSYDKLALSVSDLIAIPRHFVVPETIEKRKPLAQTARRAGWIGCNILIHSIPNSGKIRLIQDGVPEDRETVLRQWRSTLFLRDQVNVRSRGWLLKVMKCIEQVGRENFSLDDIYSFEDELRQAYPDNRHIRPKIRQQLQVLRDKGFVNFLGNGGYEIARR